MVDYLLNLHPVPQPLVKRPVVGNQRRPVRHGNLPEGILPRARRDARIEPVDGLAEAPGEQNVVERCPLLARLAGSYVGAVEDLVAQILKPLEGGGFEGGFSDAHLDDLDMKNCSEVIVNQDLRVRQRFF